MKKFVVAHTNLFENTNKIVFVKGTSEFDVLNTYVFSIGFHFVGPKSVDELKDMMWDCDQIVEIQEIPE